MHNLRLSKRSSKRRLNGANRPPGATLPSAEDSGSHSSLTSTLNDDLLATILSFASYAPCEDHHSSDDLDHRRLYSAYLAPNKHHTSPYAHFFSKDRDKPESRPLEQSSFGTLTHVFPLVCKRFRSLCNASDGLWSEAIERLAEKDPNGWLLALSSYEQGYEPSNRREDCGQSDATPTPSISSLVSKACRNFHASLQESSKELVPNESTAMLLFKCLAKEATPMKFEGPVFHMRTGETLHIGKPIGLHLFEPRYRLLIKEAMHGRSKYEKSGGVISADDKKKPRPRFLFSYGVSLPLVSGDPAIIVELVRCRIYDDGRADITIIPVIHARISRVWEREGGYRLMEAEAACAPRIRQRSPSSLGDPQLVTGPVFRMRSPRAHQLGIELRLILFEPRYFSMIAELTQDLDEAYRTGVIIPMKKSPRPRFIYAYGRNCMPGEKALVVEVRKCRIKGDMTADVTVVPVQTGIIETVQEFPLTIQTAQVTLRISETLESV